MIQDSHIERSSFRDPSGHVFLHSGALYRQINFVYRKHYDYLMQSGLYQSLVEKKLLIEHQEVDLSIGSREGVYKISSRIQSTSFRIRTSGALAPLKTRLF